MPNSSSSSSSRSRSNTQSQTRVTINSPHIGDLVFTDSLPSSLWEGGKKPRIVTAPGDPEDLPEIFDKVVNSREGFFKHFLKMFDNLLTDGYKDLALEIGNTISEEGAMSWVVILTGVIDEYVEAGKTMDALYVYRKMLESEKHCTHDAAPNAYTYTVIIKALAADPEPNFLEVAKECVMAMIGKGLQPNASTYTSVLEAYERHEKMEEGKMFLEEMKANGFVADREAMRAMRHVLKGKRPLVRIIIDILFGDSEHDDDEINKTNIMMECLSCPLNAYVCNKYVIEDDPENPKDMQYVFDTMCRMEPLIHTVTRMANMLKKDGFISQFHELSTNADSGDVPEVVIHTGVIEIYAKNDQAKEAHKVFRRMLSLGVTPNAYTYSVIIKALAKDSEFLEDAKTYLLEMMDKGMLPNARTYVPVFKAFARLEEDNVKNGKEFLMEMKAKGFRAKKKAVMEVLQGRKGPVVQAVIKILFDK